MLIPLTSRPVLLVFRAVFVDATVRCSVFLSIEIDISDTDTALQGVDNAIEKLSR